MLNGEQRRNQHSSFILLGLQQRKERPWPLSSYVYHFLTTWHSAEEPDDFWAHKITNNRRKLQFYILSSAWTKTNQKPKQNQNLAQWLVFYSESVPQYCFPGEVLMYWLANTMLLTYQNIRSFENPLNLSLKNYLLLYLSNINVKTAQKKPMANLGWSPASTVQSLPKD